MAADKRRTPDEIAFDRALIADLMFTHSLAEIAGVLLDKHQRDLSISTISRDIKAIEEAFDERISKDIKRHRHRLANELGALRRRAYKELDESAKQSERKKVKTGGREGPSVEKTTEQRAGDSRYMTVIAKTIEIEAKLLGANAPEQVEVSGKDGKPIAIVKVAMDTDEL